MFEGDYELRWPRDLVREVLGGLVNDAPTAEWRERITMLLDDAFTTNTPAEEFEHHGKEVPTSLSATDPWTQPAAQPAPKASQQPQQRYLASILRTLDDIPYIGFHNPYHSQRKAGSTNTELSLRGVAIEFRRLVLNLESRGYFEQAFGKDCVDDAPPEMPGDVIETRLGRPGLWPLDVDALSANPDHIFDLVEVLHDLAALPRKRWWHDWSGCGWHYSNFSVGQGRTVYRWSVNRILDRSDLGLRLAEDGEDKGRLVTTTDPSRQQLATQMAAREDPSTGDRVRHALSLFRSRGASEHDKRSACIALAGVLEERRALLKQDMMKKDEGALFDIANNFAIRHQKAQQQADYDPVFWLF